MNALHKGANTAREQVAVLANTLRTATALLIALAVVLGVLAGSLVAPPGPVLVVTAIAGLLAAALGRGRRRVWLPGLLLAALALGLWRYEASRPPGGAAGLPFYIGRDVTLTGTVAAEPEPLDRGENLRVAVQALTTAGRSRPVTGLVLVHLATLSDLAYGDEIEVGGTLAAPPILPGGSPAAYRAYLASQGIQTVMDFPRLRHLGTGAGNPLLALAIALRDFLAGGIRRILPGPEAALLLGILLGTRTRALGALTAPFIATGMIHVVAIDGFKITLVTGLTDLLTRHLVMRWFLKHNPSLRDRPLDLQRVWQYRVRQLASPVPLITLLLYVLVTGATPAGLRAAVMWILVIAAPFFGRRSDSRTSLALAAAFLALASPRILWDLGFQFSLFGTAGILFITPHIEQWLLTPRVERWIPWLPPFVRNLFAESFAVTVAAQIGTLPLQTAGFGQASLIGPLANALLLPLLGPIMALGLPAAVAGALLPALGILLGWLIYPFLALMIAVVQLLARLPFAALPASAWPLAPIAAYYALVALAAWLPSRATSHAGLPMPRIPPLPAALGAVALLLATVAWQAPPALYTLSILNLGGGQALLLTTPHGHAVLIDGGDKPSLLAAALGARLPFWHAHLDTVISTDVDTAHIGGLNGLTTRYGVGSALDPGAIYPPAGYALWRAELRNAGVPESKLRTGARYRLDGAYLDVLLPQGLDPAVPRAPAALRLVLGRFSLLVLNRSALDVDPTVLQAGEARGDTAVALPAGASNPASYATLVRLYRPRLVALPSADDAHDDTSADLSTTRAAHAIGARAWQGGDGSTLTITTDGTRYSVTG